MAVSVLLFLGPAGMGSDTMARSWMILLVCLIPPYAAFACFQRSRVSNIDRPAWRLLGLGVGMWAVGVICQTASSVGQQTIAAPDWYDIFFLAMYPCFYAGLILVLRNRLRNFRHQAFFDVMAGVLLLLTIVFTLLHGQAERLTDRSGLEQVILLAYPIADIGLLLLLASFFRFTDNRLEGPWPLLAAGLFLFVVADLALAASGPLDHQAFATLVSLWLFGLLFMIAAAWRDDGDVRDINPGLSQLVLPLVYMLVGLLILGYGQNRDLWNVALVALGLAMILTLVRVTATTREYRRLVTDEQASLRDETTGLPSRSSLDSWLSDLADIPERIRPPVIVLSIALDQSGELRSGLDSNDNDTVLRVAACRLRRTVSQWGRLALTDRSEFALLCTGGSAPAPTKISSQIQESFADPFLVKGVQLQVRPTIAVARYPEDTTDHSQLLQVASLRRDADTKGQAGPALVPVDLESGIRAFRLVDELRRGISEGEIRLRFQPKVNTTDGSVASVEALARWQHPQKGLLGPAAFIPLAEQHGLLPALTDVVFEQTLDQILAWRSRGIHLRVAVNIGMDNVLDSSLGESILDRCRRAAVTPDRLTLEVSEKIVTSGSRPVADNLGRLSAAGFRLSLDDFGAGTTALAYLRSLPVSEVKLDRSLIVKMGESRHDSIIAEGVIDICRELGLHTVVEGVESGAVARRLIELDCGEIQGYCFARPMPGSEIDEWLDAFDPGERFGFRS
ncbi:MAG: EAL domain-containing protein [Solirubrobacterales bacterium]|nr:EAL domain-containing protein [Solirubrobacterales bacterium]